MTMVWDHDVRKPGGSKNIIVVYNKEELAYVQLWPWWVPIVILSK